MEDQSPLGMKPLAIALTLALAGYAHASDDPASSEAPATASARHVAAAVAPGLYAQDIGESRFESRHLELKDNGYTVQSGALLGARGDEGALILVQAPDGTLTGIISRPGKSGLLQVSPDGKRTFYPEADVDFMRADTVPSSEDEPVPPAAANTEVIIDALVGFTQSALQKIDVSPEAYALSQLEYVNLSLRNSRIENVRLNLAGIRVYDEDIPVTTAGLARWQTLLTPLRSQYKHDINIGYSVGGDAGGWAYVPGFTSVNLISAPTAFKHEMGHNVGGSHCNTDGSDNYKFGHDAGDNVRTNLCGNSTAYYSNPDIVYQGHQMGNAKTANMARLWREQSGRLSGYSEGYSGYRMVHAGIESALTLGVWGNKAAYLALTSDIGPVQPVQSTLNPYTKLNVTLADATGQTHTVVMRGTCKANATEWVAMHNKARCGYFDDATLKLEFLKTDNRGLAAGWYNGPLELKAIGPFGEVRILVSISIKS